MLFLSFFDLMKTGMADAQRKSEAARDEAIKDPTNSLLLLEIQAANAEQRNMETFTGQYISGSRDHLKELMRGGI
jgi:hypothetical protein